MTLEKSEKAAMNGGDEKHEEIGQASTLNVYITLIKCIKLLLNLRLLTYEVRLPLMNFSHK